MSFHCRETNVEPYVPDFYGPSEQTDQRTIEIGIVVLHNVCYQAKVGVLRAPHKIFNSEVRICWNDVSKFSSISSSQLTFCCVSGDKLKIS
jgi:hypothetical protein